MPRSKPTTDDATTGAAGKSVKTTGKSAGRVTPKGGVPARPAAVSGRYTPPIPKDRRHSPPWYPWVLLTLLIAGLAIIVLNYANVMPGGISNYYLIAGIAGIVAGLVMATFYR